MLRCQEDPARRVDSAHLDHLAGPATPARRAHLATLDGLVRVEISQVHLDHPEG